MNEEDFKKAAKLLLKKNVPHISEGQIDLHNDSAYYWPAENFSQASEWIKETVKILEDPVSFSNAVLFTNFFGIINNNELSDFLKVKAIGSLTGLGYAEDDIPKVIEAIQDPEDKQYFKIVWEAKELFDPIQKQFSDDEKFLLRFLRHRACHPTLSDFAVKIENTGDSVKFKTSTWERLVKLSKIETVESFRKLLIRKLTPSKDALARISVLLMPSGGSRLFQE